MYAVLKLKSLNVTSWTSKTVPSVGDTPPSVSESLTLIQPNTEYRSCGNGQYLDITYGRYYCSNGSASVTDRMNTNCNYNSACTIQAQNNWLGGNPCVGITKTLEWTDACRGKSNRLISYSCFYLIIKRKPTCLFQFDFGISYHRRLSHSFIEQCLMLDHYIYLCFKSME